MQVVEINDIQRWNKTLRNQQKNFKNHFNFGDYVLRFLKGNKSHLGKFIRKWFEPFKV
jgi:hypothetical protein